jgi:tripartite ATP-independent transporter DctM subunit
VTIIFGTIAKISIGQLLIGGIVPGAIMALCFAGYIVIRSLLNPALAPPYEVTYIPIRKKMADFVRYVLPLGLIVFLAVVVIFLGVATPSEAAATAAFGALILAAAYRELNWTVLKKSMEGTVRVTVMVFVIIAFSTAFSQILAFSGSTQGLVQAALSLTLPPWVIFLFMQIVILLLGLFIDIIPLMMITLPVYMPISNALGFDPIWFGLITLITISLGALTPPFGLNLFVMKGVAPSDIRMGDIYKASIPYILIQFIVIALAFPFPQIMTWLPNLMRR